MEKGLNAKMQCLNSNKELFKQFQELARLGEYLNVAIVMANEDIKVYHYDENRDKVINIGEFDYDSEGRKGISELLEKIASDPKKKWSSDMFEMPWISQGVRSVMAILAKSCNPDLVTS